MMPTRRGAVALRACVRSLLWIAGGALTAQSQQVADTTRTLRGVVSDSLRGGMLANAFVELLPLGRQVETNNQGYFEFRGVPEGGPFTLRVMHALLDTLGVGLESPAFAMRGQLHEINLIVPSPTRLLAMVCDERSMMRGPGAVVGFAQDPDTGVPIDSATVSLVYDESPIKRVKMPVTRTTRTDAQGRYRICGLPAPMSGNVLLSRDGIVSGDIPVTTSAAAPLTRRALGLSLSTRSVLAAADSGEGNVLRVLEGDAVVTGRVVNKSGKPVPGARVQMDGTLAVAITRSDGTFTLDSVPAGSQIVSARKIGFSVTEAAIDVRLHDAAGPAVTLVMQDFVPMLAPVVTVSQRTRDMESTGFARRRAQGFGYFLEGEQIDRGPPTLGESLRLIPGLRIGYDAGNMSEQKAMIMNSRDPRGCLRYVVDGVYWQEVGGDIEDFVKPQELEAIEMYSAMTVPGEFAVAGRGRCSVLVLWTRHKIRPAKRSR